MTLHGSCHCGAVTFDFEGAPTKAMTCNCSICRRNGSVLHFVMPDQFTLTSGADALTEYEFYRHIVTHSFCRHCGSSVFARTHPPDRPHRVAINLRCTEVDLAGVELTEFNGAAM